MKFKIFFLLFLFFQVTYLKAAEFPKVISAIRNPDEDWQDALARQNFSSFNLLSPAWNQVDPGIDILPVWTGSMEALQQAFERSRDEAAYPNPQIRIGFPRRSTWLYPQDGCFARAAHVSRSFERQGYVRPGRVYAFGRLRSPTPYSKSGWVYWSYHVAAAINVNGVAMVIDPPVDPRRLIPFQEWVNLIARDPSKITTRFCDTYAYMPGHKCVGGGEAQERGALLHQLGYLTDEWNNLRAMGFDPLKLLGNSPPWK